MGIGTVTFYWYGACCCFVAFTGLIAAGLFAWGRREQRQAASDAAAPSPEEDA